MRMNGLLFHSGPIYTLDARRPQAEALLVRGERIAALGSESEVRAALNDSGPDSAYDDIDLRGRALLPGLTDAHIHLAWTGLLQSGVALEGIASLDAALDKIASHAATLPADAWVRGHGWNHALWDNRWPTKTALDRVTGGRPALLSRKDGHSVWINSRALQLADVDVSTPDPDGGAIQRDSAGQPTGILLESANALAYRAAPDYTLDEKRMALRSVMAACNRVGLTGVHIVEGRDTLRLLQELRARGRLTLRALCHLPHAQLDAAIGIGLRSGLGDEWLRIGGVKIFADGSLGSQTCHMLKPFDSDEKNASNCGLPMMPEDELRADIVKAATNGWALTVHAIGDRANRTVLDALSQPEVRAAHCALPHRIEHAQHLHPQDITRFAELGVVASMQPIHAIADWQVAEKLLGPERCRGAYAFRPLLQSGAALAFGSDAPVESFNPWLGLHAAITRRRVDDTSRAGWNPELALDLAEALEAYGVGPAHAAGESRLKGSLVEGKLADLIVTEADPFAVARDDVDALARMRVRQTFVAGQCVWEA